MKATTLTAIAASVIISSFGISKNERKNDIFLKADQNYHGKKCCSQVRVHKHRACGQLA